MDTLAGGTATALAGRTTYSACVPTWWMNQSDSPMTVSPSATSPHLVPDRVDRSRHVPAEGVAVEPGQDPGVDTRSRTYLEVRN
jgi:hypothetical protein